jgi:hypothetical protein
MLVGDTEDVVYQLDVKALSLFGDGVPSKGLYTMAEYSKLLQARGVRAESLVTRISFDTDSSVPKLFFTPQAFVDQNSMPEILKLAKSPDVKKMLEVTLETVDLSGEVDASNSDAPAPAATSAPAPAAKKAAAKATPASAPAPVPEPTVALPMDEDLESMLEGLM